jgi:hypothetical protein
MPGAEFEHTISVFERAKRVHVLDSSATVIGIVLILFASLLVLDSLYRCEKLDYAAERILNEAVVALVKVL